LEVYPTVLTAGESSGLATSVRRSGAFLQSTIGDLLGATLAEAEALRLPVSPEPFPDSRWNEDPLRSRLPADIGQRDLSSDEHKAAELASRFVQTAREFEGRSIRPLAGEAERERWMQRNCSEEQARSLEASVHNLQSAYDTWIKGSDLESADARLPRLRGHASIALHLLEAVTQLVHFVERHERNDGDASIPRRLTGLVSRATARDVTLNLLLVPAALVITRGRVLAEDVLPSYTRLQQLELELPHDVAMHARPAALIVAVVNRHGTPVELEVDGRRCNAGSILDMMVTIGSSPDARTFRFRGDEHPLRDIALLFQSRLGENGLDSLPIGLAYLRGGT
jgi:phosphotransferase system HPr-like phosphotransfer protein